MITSHSEVAFLMQQVLIWSRPPGSGMRAGKLSRDILYNMGITDGAVRWLTIVFCVFGQAIVFCAQHPATRRKSKGHRLHNILSITLQHPTSLTCPTYLLPFIQCKMIGRRNKYSMIYAFFDALVKHRGIESIARSRGKRILSLQREMAGRFA